MTTYAKLIDGQPRFLRGAHNIANATEAQLAEYAAAHGYKPATITNSPGLYYSQTWEETEDRVQNTWTAWDLDDAKAAARVRINDEFTATLNTPAVIPCPALGETCHVLCDLNQMLNILGDLEGADTYEDADGHRHENTEELREAVRSCYVTYRNSLYSARKAKEDAVAAAEDVDELEAIINGEQ